MRVRLKNGSCMGFHTCRLPAKHPEVSKELQELKNLIKDLDKKEAKTNSETQRTVQNAKWLIN